MSLPPDAHPSVALRFRPRAIPIEDIHIEDIHAEFNVKLAACA